MSRKLGLHNNKNNLKLSALALAVSIVCVPTYAARVEVNSTVDKVLANSADGLCNLRDAVFSINLGTFNTAGSANDQANGCNLSSTGSLGSNDRIEFSDTLDNSTIVMGLPPLGLGLQRAMSINEEARAITISADNRSRHFNIPAGVGEPIILNHLRLTDGFLDGDGLNIGGSLFVLNGSTLTIRDTTIDSNTAAIGAAIWASDENTKVIIERSVISNNVGIGPNAFGGGVFLNLGADMDIVDSTISGNTVDGFGGGILTGADGGESLLEITSSTIANNVATVGGGIDVLDGTLTLKNSTVSKNNASFVGGIVVREDGDGAQSKVMMYNSTVAFNTSGTVGGMQILDGAEVIVRNSILSNSTGDSAANDNCVKDVNTPNIIGTFSIVQNSTSCAFGADVDPGLLSLSFNGAETKTHALKLGSLAVGGGDNATCLATDQRGVSRQLSIVDRCDIGAFEQTEDDRKKLQGDFIVVPLSGKRAVVIPN